MSEDFSFQSASVSPAPNPARRQRLLAAAEQLFSRVGYRAATIGAIASEAGLAKATVYAYFADKDEIFRAVADSVARRLLAVVTAGLVRDATLSTRLVAALQGKDLLLLTLVTASPHAGELFEARDRLVRALFDDTDRKILEQVAAALDDGVDRGLAPTALARVLVRASRGLAARTDNADMLSRDIEYLVTRLVAEPHAEARTVRR